jgi:hypothetical protein
MLQILPKDPAMSKKHNEAKPVEVIEPDLNQGTTNPGTSSGTGGTLTPATNFGTNEGVSPGSNQKKSEIEKNIERMKKQAAGKP